ncbi:MAG: DUF1848 domain-containing protein [Acidobacteria bacterium]|nr:MAG: DUF1848 domain-containing protein [Acidobacteriota bacterium]
MIVSASRRTDIPAFYLDWWIGRLRARRVRVVNPFNARQQREVRLDPDAVDAIVFWTRAPGRLARALDAIRATGHRRLAALVTVTGYGPPLEPHGPSLRVAIDGFLRLAAALGPGAVRWRYDPIVLGPREPPARHAERFARIARALEGATDRVIVSFVDFYRKTERRLATLVPGGWPAERDAAASARGARLLADLVRIARAHGMHVTTCAEERDFGAAGAAPGACIDPGWLAGLFPERSFPRVKDRGQRPACRCAPSVDVGAPDTCLFGCAYCYATRSESAARARHARHDPAADTLVPPASSAQRTAGSSGTASGRSAGSTSPTRSASRTAG